MSRWNALIFVLACLVLASCDQPLTGPEAIAVTGVELDSELLELSVGDAYELAATVLPHNASNQQVEWSSSDSEIATVTARGTVTAVNEGTARITAMTDDGATPVLRPIDRSADRASDTSASIIAWIMCLRDEAVRTSRVACLKRGNAATSCESLCTIALRWVQDC